ncbi:MAG: hypothetical protein JWO78_1706 [Micavibrio sp.]|nr:hypothetical protein [Micavibrio sp.]
MISFLSDSNFLDADAKVVHGFFGRRGGISTGLYGSLNCGMGTKDAAVNVIHNRNAVADALAVVPTGLVSVKQVHSAVCLYVDKPWAKDERPEADAMVTDRRGLALGILTADCGPVLFHGEKADGHPVIGAAHAGWGGAFKGILEATVNTMTGHGAIPATIRASVGPCIAQKSYEVGNEFIARFLDADPANEHFFKDSRKADHMMFDLAGYIASRLAQVGVRQVSLTGIDTYAHENDYFSFRRTTHKGEPDYGRQISAIAIR